MSDKTTFKATVVDVDLASAQPITALIHRDYQDKLIDLIGTTDWIVDGNVTLVKIQNISTGKILARFTAGSGPPEQVDALPEWIATVPASLTATGEQGEKAQNDYEVWMCYSANSWLKTAKDVRVTGIDAKTLGQTTIGAAYAGKRLIVQSAKILITNYDGAGKTIDAVVSIGNNVNLDNVVVDTTLTTPAANKLYDLTIASNNIDASTDALQLNVDTATDATTFEFMILFKATLEG